MYKQCVLIKEENGSLLTKVSWIPKKFAVVGEILKIRNRGEKWDDGWTVKETFSCLDNPPELPRWTKLCKDLNTL